MKCAYSSYNTKRVISQNGGQVYCQPSTQALRGGGKPGEHRSRTHVIFPDLPGFRIYLKVTFLAGTTCNFSEFSEFLKFR